MVICPYCEGDGLVVEWYDDVMGNTKTFTDTCTCCDGEGEIPKEELKIAKEVYRKTNAQLIEEMAMNEEDYNIDIRENPSGYVGFTDGVK